MPLYFVTGSKNKFAEAKAILPELEQLELDLVEIQCLDSNEIIRAKLEEAKNHTEGKIIVEDSSLQLDCLGGLPGPLIKWFLVTIGLDGIYELTRRLDNHRAVARATIGYLDREGVAHVFSGKASGDIVKARGDKNFGWDPIFRPDGEKQTLAEMSQDEKNHASPRGMAFWRLKEYFTAG